MTLEKTIQLLKNVINREPISPTVLNVTPLGVQRLLYYISSWGYGGLGIQIIFAVSSDFGDGITLTPDCTQLREPMVSVTVEPSLQNIIRDWEGNTSEKTYRWSYVCEGKNGVRASLDYFANVSGGRSVLYVYT